MMKKYCYIILSHYNDIWIDNIKCKIESDFKDRDDVDVKIITTSNEKWEDIKKSYNTFNVIGLSNYIGNSIFPVLQFMKQYQYDYYIVQEYDCQFVGNYNGLLNIIKDQDFIFQSEPQETNKWYWDVYNNFPDHIDKKYHCLLNWYVVKNEVLNYLYELYDKKIICGHYEGLIPTMIINKNFKIDYLTNYCNVIAGTDLSSFSSEVLKFVQKLNMEEVFKNTLVHPIKPY